MDLDCRGRRRLDNREDIMLKPYVVYFKYKPPGEKKAGAIKQYRVYANNHEEARRLVTQHATYPDIEVLDIKAA